MKPKLLLDFVEPNKIGNHRFFKLHVQSQTKQSTKIIWRSIRRDCCGRMILNIQKTLIIKYITHCHEIEDVIFKKISLKIKQRAIKNNSNFLVFWQIQKRTAYMALHNLIVFIKLQNTTLTNFETRSRG
jgi:hypothetical protein